MPREKRSFKSKFLTIIAVLAIMLLSLLVVVKTSERIRNNQMQKKMLNQPTEEEFANSLIFNTSDGVNNSSQKVVWVGMKTYDYFSDKEYLTLDENSFGINIADETTRNYYSTLASYTTDNQFNYFNLFLYKNNYNKQVGTLGTYSTNYSAVERQFPLFLGLFYGNMTPSSSRNIYKYNNNSANQDMNFYLYANAQQTETPSATQGLVDSNLSGNPELTQSCSSVTVPYFDDNFILQDVTEDAGGVTLQETSDKAYRDEEGYYYYYIKIRNETGWSKFYVYSWNNYDGEVDYSELTGSWPGIYTTRADDGYYYYGVRTKASSINLIFNAGRGMPQTEDIENILPGWHEFVVYQYNNNGDKVVGYSEVASDTEPTRETTYYYYYIHVNDGAQYQNMHIYAWDNSIIKTNLTGAYPGDVMMPDPGYPDWYTYEIISQNPEINILFVGSNNEQTIDITGLTPGVHSYLTIPGDNGNTDTYIENVYPGYTNSAKNTLGKIYENVQMPLRVDISESGVTHYKFDSSQDVLQIDESGASTYYYNENIVESITGENGFFPYNTQDDSESVNLNYGFGARIDIPIRVTEDRKITAANGSEEDMVLNISGDDDIWVFIDDVLFLDLGGVHYGTVSGTLNLTEGFTEVSAVKDYDSCTSSTTVTDTINNPLDIAVGKTTYFSSYELAMFSDPSVVHELTIFYLEREGTESVFDMEFNFLVDLTENIEGYKEWDDDDDELGLRPDEYAISVYANDTFVQRKTFASSESHWIFENLPIYDEDNDIIEYTYVEDDVEYYSVEYDYETNTITNVINVIGNITVRKRWENERTYGADKPEAVRVSLLRRTLGDSTSNLQPSSSSGENQLEGIEEDADENDGEDETNPLVSVGWIDLNSQNFWEDSFEHPLKYDDSGNLYKYYIIEDTDLDWYESAIYYIDEQDHLHLYEDFPEEGEQQYNFLIENTNVHSEVLVHYYKEGTTDKLSNDVTISGKIDDSYSTSSATDISDKYELVAEPNNKNGTMTQDQIVVNYYYRLKDTSVLVHHYKEGTTDKLSGDVTITGQVDDSYTTTAATDIPGYYELAAEPANKAGTMTVDQIVVTYYYRLKSYPYVVNYLEKDTNQVLNTQKQGANQTYGTVINSADERISITGYNYDSVDKDTLTIGTTGNVINIYYTKRNDLSYTVNYLESLTNTVLHEPKTVNNQTYQAVIEAEDEVIDIDGYTYDYPNKESITLDVDSSNNIINIYYSRVTGLSYTVNYLEKGTNEVLAPASHFGDMTFGDVVDTSDEIVSISGYNYDSADKDSLTIGTDANANVINLYYTKKTNLSYTVNYLEKDTNTVLHTPKTQGSMTFGATVTSSNEVIDIDGYDYDSVDKASLTIIDGENVINIYYTKRNDLGYTVNYLEKDTNIVLHEQKIANNQVFNSVITSSDEVIDIDGYNYYSVDKTSLTITTGENVINIYYTKRTDLSYKVNYLEKDTNTVLHEQKVENNQVFNSVITSSDEVIDIDGYNYDSVDKASLTITTGENIINIYYTKRNDLSYTVNYLEKDTNTVLHETKTQGGMTFKDVVVSSNEVIEIDGYNYNSVDKDSLTITTGENVINIYYTKRNNLEYRVNYLEKDTNRVLHSQKIVNDAVFESVVNSADGLTYTVNYLEKDTENVLHDPKTQGNMTFEDVVEAADEIIGIYGYNYDSADIDELTITTGENVINLYYTKKDTAVNVHYYEEGTTNKVSERRG